MGSDRFGLRARLPAVTQAEIGVIGGSGLYQFLTALETVATATPWGDPSAPITIAAVGDRRVAFLPRHGLHHEFPAHRVNYRANIWALRDLGVTQILAPFACGSLQLSYAPGALVVPDQLVDFTRGRAETYFDGPVTNHVSIADPYCSRLRSQLLTSTTAAGHDSHDGSTVVVINGPRFASRAESRWYSRQGWDLINMTQLPEAPLARELGICFAGLALVTDYDAGVEGRDDIAAVTQDEVFAFFAQNIDVVRDVLIHSIANLPMGRGCECGNGPGGLEPVVP